MWCGKPYDKLLAFADGLQNPLVMELPPVIIQLLDWDFLWNEPSSYCGYNKFQETSIIIVDYSWW